jgi:hypothetical protein
MIRPKPARAGGFIQAVLNNESKEINNGKSREKQAHRRPRTGEVSERKAVHRTAFQEFGPG